MTKPSPGPNPKSTPKPTHALGIDPGAHGALALLNLSTRAIDALFDMPLDSDGRVDAAALAMAVDVAEAEGAGSGFGVMVG